MSSLAREVSGCESSSLAAEKRSAPPTSEMADQYRFTSRATLSPIENLGVGAFGGALETCLQMPVLTYKFCLQEGRPLPKTFTGWYRGLAVQAGTVAPITAIQFATNGALQGALLKMSPGRTELSDVETMCAAAGAGAISAAVYGPVDLVTIQQQKMGLSPWQTVRRLVQSHGATSLFRGLASCAVREAVYTGGYLGLAPVITTRLAADGRFGEALSDRPLAAGIVGACVAGTTAAVLTHPVDTAKTCVQSDMGGGSWGSATSAIPKLVRTGGIASLYRGIIPRTVRLCGAFFVCMMIREGAIEYKTSKEQQQR
uniref:Mitochondrial carrier protein n=1 Tax=Trieres chinensis TaxID=1514140 RepID=A0A7S2AAG0_TRICV|mmetsp:Transcript_9033/g.19146  ORF Transcript_9033/g.19146 Transcript_9033/m.19146 type:complete len:314 (+) Transcript_9033:231-1172(+)